MIHDLVEGDVIRTINVERVLYVEWKKGSNRVAVCMGDVTLNHNASDAKAAEDLFDEIRERLSTLRALPVEQEGAIRAQYTPKRLSGN